MSFLHPEFLYFMVVPLVVLFALLLTQKESQEEFFSKEVLEKLKVFSSGLNLKARNGIFFFIGLLIIISLAQPIIEDKEIQVKSKSADVIIALDISDSMRATDVYPNRLINAKEKIKEFLNLGKNERYAILAFAKNSFLVSPLTFDKLASRFLLEKLDVNSITEKGTNFFIMLESIKKSFDTKARKFVVIFTDGGDNVDYSKEIAYAKKHNIVVMVLGFGTSSGAPIKDENGIFIKDKAANILISKRNDLIEKLTNETGGVYVKAIKTDDDIKAIYNEISKMAPKELQDGTVKKHIPLFYYPLALALLLLLIATSSFPKPKNKNIKSFLFLLSFLGFSTSSEALVLDFLDIQEAKTAYEKQDYEKAAKLYLQHAKDTENPASYYNGANALYKQQNYQDAIKNYQHAKFKEKEKQAKKYANLGNAHAMLSTQENLEKAIENYEKSLELEESKNIRENLINVKKALEEIKKQEQENNDNKEKNKDNNGENKDEQDDNNEKDDENSENQEDKQGLNQDKDKSDNDEKQDEHTDENTKEDSEKNKEETNENKEEEMGTSSQEEEKEMSEEEVNKWLEKLNNKSSTYIYQLNEKNTTQDKHYDKPW